MSSDAANHLRGRSSLGGIVEDIGASDSDVPAPDSTQDQMQASMSKHGAKAEALLQQEQWAKAAQELAAALKYVVKRDEHADLLCKRSRALCSFSEQLRSIPAAASERHALFAHDPTHIAQLALKDAQKAAQLKPSWPTVYVQQGRALQLLERYGDAEACYLEGLLLAPGQGELTTGLEQVQSILAEQAQERRQALATHHQQQQQQQQEEGLGGGSPGRDAAAAAAEAGEGQLTRTASSNSNQKRQRRMSTHVDVDDVECSLCMKLLYEPVTTPCGHSFCKECFARSMDHSSKCPMCRTVLHVARELPISITLHNIIRRAHAAEYAARAEEAAAEALAIAGAGAQRLPLFVMCAMLPGEKMALNIFEPRYRLMVRRCMEGSRRFGMSQVGPGHQVEPVACEVEIVECEPQPDGRYYLDIVGRQRIRIQDSWEQDGYRVASVERLTDADVAGDPAAAERLATVLLEVKGQAQAVLERLRTMLSMGRGGSDRMRALMDRVGPQPSVADPEAFSWWVGRLLLMMGADNEGPLRRDLLAAPDSLSRLEYEQRQLTARLDTSSCNIM